MSLNAHPAAELWAQCKRAAQVCTENPPFGPGVILGLVTRELKRVLNETATNLEDLECGGEMDSDPRETYDDVEKAYADGFDHGQDTAIREISAGLRQAAEEFGGSNAEQR